VCPPEGPLDSPITPCHSSMLEEVGRMSFGAWVVERFVHALCKACGDLDDQKSAVVYGIATCLSFPAPTCLSGASSLSNRSRIGQELERWNSWTFSEFAGLTALGRAGPMTYGDSRSAVMSLTMLRSHQHSPSRRRQKRQFSRVGVCHVGR
jgi:hypothetical protein